MKRRAIVSFANQAGLYLARLKRQGISLENDGNADYFPIINEESVGSPKHIENPYAFKIYCIDYVISLGYTQILWLDSSIAVMQNTKPVWDVIDKLGYFMQEAGWMVGQWSNDETLEYFGIHRDEAMKMMMYGNCGLLGLDFENKKAAKFFKLWKKSMLDGYFKGSWENHRHDMTCGSIIANKLSMKMQRGDQWLSYAAEGEPIKNESIIFHGI
jgi:hypothetical protein